MGVPGLQTWLRRRYGDAFVPLPSGGFDHVYIDMSSTLHQVIRRARTKQYFHYTLHRRLDDILASTSPRKRVVLALDGPAPLAKLLEQRRRRRRELDRAARKTEVAAEAAAAAAEAVAAAQAAAAAAGEEGGEGGGEGFSSTVDALGIKGTFRPPNPELSTLALTTGSQLMLEVHASLQTYICKKLADPATAHLSFELSDSTVKGEGELKILSRLLHPGERVASGPGGGPADGGSSSSDGSGGETHLVLSSDSDLLLMSMVAGQRGVYIIGDLFEDRRHPHRHPTPRRQQQQQEELAAAAAQQLEADAAAAAAAALLQASSSDETDGDSGTDTETEGEESESEPEEPQLGGPLPLDSQPAAAWAVAPAAQEEPAPSLLAFSQDALEALWREQHLLQAAEQPAGGGGGEGGRGRGGERGRHCEQADGTSLALDLMLLSVMANGNDYLPAIQGMQLSNKHRPGIWDLYLHLRTEPQWAGQWLVQRHCHCGAEGGSQAWRPCPSIRLNLPMLRQLLADYHGQRYVHMLHDGLGEVGGSAGEAEALASSMEGSTGGSLDGGSMDSSLSASGGGSLDGGSLDGGLGTAPAEMGGTAADPRPVYVWNAEGLAAAAALAHDTESDADAAEGAEGAAAAGAQQRRRRHSRLLPQGTEPQPDNYIKGLEWLLQMYSSGAIRDYRFAYDFMAPSLPELMRTLGSMQEQQEMQRAQRDAPQGSATEGEQQQLGAGGAAAVTGTQEATAARQRRSLQPLLPAACAMALLPRGGRMHAATALQHLMDEGSALEEIYAVCDQCTALGQRLGAVAREIDGVRAELLQLGAADSLGDEAALDNAALVEQLEAELERLRQTMSQLQRTQTEHQYEAHPYRPFPTEALEAAVAAVPLESYPESERRLAQFGREFVYFSAPFAVQQGGGKGEGGAGAGAARTPLRSGRRQRDVAAAAASGSVSGSTSGDSIDAPASSVGSDGEEEGEQGAETLPALLRPPQRPRHWTHTQGWVRETLAFVAAYPRLADPWLIRRANNRVQREVLPLRPYMQPPRRPAGEQKALSALCQEQQWQQAERALQQPRRGTTVRRHALQPQQAAGLHTASLAAGRGLLSSGALQPAGPHGTCFGSGRALMCPVRAQLPGASTVRAALVQAGTRLLGNLRMLRVL